MDQSRPSAQPHITSKTLTLSIDGTWLVDFPIPETEPVQTLLAQHTELTQITFQCENLQDWDSTLLTYIFRIHDLAQTHDLDLDLSPLPDGAVHLVRMATTATTQVRSSSSSSWNVWSRLGHRAMLWWQEALDILDFTGSFVLSWLRLMRGQRSFRTRDLTSLLYFCGAKALPIVSLISILVGLILAFVGAVQLQYFGAQIYVADLVSIAMTREMGAIMTGVIMAGRTGAAFAAQLGTMQVNEEIDALRTLGLSSFDFLVLPRILALTIMMPLLCVYADVVGILGGALVGVGMLDLAIPLYWKQSMEAITMTYVWLGLIKSCAFGFIVAATGCLRGLQSGRSAESVGQAATSAVVTAIVAIIVVDGLFAVLCDILGI